MKNYDIYLYGMILKSNGFLLRESYPNPDGYGEIKEKHTFPGGETGNAAAVLASLGCRVKMDGNHIGMRIADEISSFYNKAGVDISSLYFDPNYDGLEDYIIIDRESRTVFGTFAAYFNGKEKHWNVPSEKDIKQCRVAGIDPFFGEESLTAARFCHYNNVPFVTIDCGFDSELCRLASVIVVSGEYIRNHYSDYTGENSKSRLLQKYAENTDSLIIFTSGNENILYGRKGFAAAIPAYNANVKSTLGAGDTFKAGCVYSLFKGFTDEETVKFAAACAAIACSRFPIAFFPPKTDEIYKLI